MSQIPCKSLGSGSRKVTGHPGKGRFGILGFCAAWMQRARSTQADAQGLWKTGEFLVAADFSTDITVMKVVMSWQSSCVVQWPCCGICCQEGNGTHSLASSQRMSGLPCFPNPAPTALYSCDTYHSDIQSKESRVKWPQKIQLTNLFRRIGILFKKISFFP